MKSLGAQMKMNKLKLCACQENEMLGEMLMDWSNAYNITSNIEKHLFLTVIKLHSNIGGQTHPTFRPTLVFCMSGEMLDAFDRGFRIT